MFLLDVIPCDIRHRTCVLLLDVIPLTLGYEFVRCCRADVTTCAVAGCGTIDIRHRIVRSCREDVT